MTRTPVIVGGGSWGSALATALQATGQTPVVLVRNAETVRLLATGRCRQLADLPPVSPIRATTDPAILGEAGLVFLVVPVSATAAALAQVVQHAGSPDALVLCAKGMAMTEDGAALMPELAGSLVPKLPAVILSGPSFADEVMAGLPAAVTAAGTDEAAVATVQDSFAGSHLRVYANTDPLGVAIGGTMKNVIAIAAGCAIGLGLGDTGGDRTDTNLGDEFGVNPCVDVSVLEVVYELREVLNRINVVVWGRGYEADARGSAPCFRDFR